jgi:hypothetical protein
VVESSEPGYAARPGETSLLALHQRQRAEILVTDEQQIKGEEDETGGLAGLHRRLKAREIGDAILPDRADLAVNDAVVEAVRYACQLWKGVAVVVVVARATCWQTSERHACG